MDGRTQVVLLTLLLPAVLLGVTIAWFAMNPVSILILLVVMLAGVLYLQTYTERAG
jgi:hypothetical protein